jgi:hypothetical protein
MSEPIEAAHDGPTQTFADARGVAWTTGINVTEPARPYRWFLAAGRRERRYELRNGEAADSSLASLRAQLHASVAILS